MLLSPGDYVAEVKLVWTKDIASSEKGLFLALVKAVNYRQTFGTTEGLASFIEHIRKKVVTLITKFPQTIKESACIQQLRLVSLFLAKKFREDWLKA